MQPVVAPGTPAAPSFPFSEAAVATAQKKLEYNLDVGAQQQGAHEGVVVAALSKQSPNYWYHWQRDAAIAMRSHAAPKDGMRRYLKYLGWVRDAQFADQEGGNDVRGEPKFELDGSVYTGPWGRPQNDGAALRALTLIDLANELLASGNTSLVSELYAGGLDYQQMGSIKRDLEYVSHHIADECFDAWEEVSGTSFFTRTVQRAALDAGAALATQLGDPGAADWYAQQRDAIGNALGQHWNAGTGVIMGSLPGHGGPQKYNELDCSVALAAIHGAGPNVGLSGSDWAPTDSRVLSTMEAFTAYFADVFAINQNDTAAGVPGVLLGRYPGDTYSGHDSSGGNPWILCTCAVAEVYYRAASGGAAGAANLLQKGDGIMTRLRGHLGSDDNISLSEQIQRNSGELTSANDLTWSYAALVTAAKAREAAARAVLGKFSQKTDSAQS